MKTQFTKTKQVLTAIIIASAVSNAFAQDIPVSMEIRKVGFGMKFSVLGYNDVALPANIVPGGKTFFLSFNPTKNFRFEPEFGFTHSSQPAAYSNGELVNSGRHFGSSLFGMFQKGNANFYFGPNLGVSKFTGENEKAHYNATNLTYTKESTTSKSTRIGLILGAEYFLNSHFSLAAEVGCFSAWTALDVTTATEYKSLFTTGTISLRAYF